MTVSAEARAAIRELYQYRCGYCGISEVDIGGELEIDHFQPVSDGGTDDPDNLVYACTQCNRFKSNYWPVFEKPDNLRLLHPQKDNLEEHIQETPDGRLFGQTSRGWFHIGWLHLNRPQLILWRQAQQNEQKLRDALIQFEKANGQLQQRIHQLQTEIAELRAIIVRLMSPL